MLERLCVCVSVCVGVCICMCVYGNTLCFHMLAGYGCVYAYVRVNVCVCVCVCGRARVQGRAVASEALPIVCGCVGVRVGVCHVCVHSGAG